MRVILASASPARLNTLRAAGVFPSVVVSQVDEAAVVADHVAKHGPLTPPEQALLLARAKAEAVAESLAPVVEGLNPVVEGLGVAEADSKPPAARATPVVEGLNPVVEGPDFVGADSKPPAARATPVVEGLGVAEADSKPPAYVIVGCDSIFELDGVAYGKPRTPEVAVERIRAMSGRTGYLHTGHWVITDAGAVGATGTTAVTFANMDDAEIEAYVATGEPLLVAGSFTVDGLGGPYVERIDGDYHNVVGLSLPLLRKLLIQLNIPWHTLRR